jgi:hypothetical protein
VRRYLYSNFSEDELKVINEALDLASRKVSKHFASLRSFLDRVHLPVIDERYKQVMGRTSFVIKFLERHEPLGIYEIEEEKHSIMIDVIRSSLEIYRLDLEQVRKVDADFERKIEVINELTSDPVFENAKSDLYETYCSASATPELKRPELFISYSSADKQLADQIAAMIVGKSSLFENRVFLAHRDIPMSKKWREDILAHLRSCTVLIAVCTARYRCSPWGNQEVGIALGKEDVRVIPMFFEGTNRSDFGFLEALQSLPEYIDEDNLEEAIDELVMASI